MWHYTAVHMGSCSGLIGRPNDNEGKSKVEEREPSSWNNILAAANAVGDSFM
jgi:hypothetical protein